MTEKPHVIILAGPNGAGKSTTAPMLLRDAFALEEFVNADVIAAGLSAFAPETVSIEAGRIMLLRLHKLAEKRVSFAFETTLASRSFAPWLARLMANGYQSRLIFLALPAMEAATERVALRVKLGGHNIPDDVIRRRFAASLKNFFQLYRPVVSSWMLYDNSLPANPQLLAKGIGRRETVIENQAFYGRLLKEYGNG